MEKIKQIFITQKNNFLKEKKYFLIYLIMVSILSLTMVRDVNIIHPKFELIMFIIIVILGSFFVINMNIENRELYKTAFIVLLCFGLILSFLTPILIGPDEDEHFIRSEITSEGILFPSYINNANYSTIQSAVDLANHRGEIFVNTDIDTQPINQSQAYYPNAYAQNPFFGYLAPAFGMDIAKFISLDNFGMLVLGRFMNILLFAGLTALAIRRAPIFKVPLFALACIPLTFFQAASFSIDALIFGLSFYIIAYFLYLYKSEKNSINKKKIGIFAILVLLLGLCRLPLLGMGLLILFIPKENFKNKNYYYLGFIVIAILFIIGLLWNNYYATPKSLQSYRGLYFLMNNVNLNEQISFMIIHPIHSLNLFLSLPDNFNYIFLNCFIFGSAEYGCNSPLIAMLLLLFIGSIILYYPNNEKIDLKIRIGLLFTFLLIFYGTYLIFYLTWTPIGLDYVIGIQNRYFLGLFPLLPLIFGINNKTKEKIEINKAIITMTIVFIGLTIMRISLAYY